MASPDGVSKRATPAGPSARPETEPAKVALRPVRSITRMRSLSPASATKTRPSAATAIPQGSEKRAGEPSRKPATPSPASRLRWAGSLVKRGAGATAPGEVDGDGLSTGRPVWPRRRQPNAMTMITTIRANDIDLPCLTIKGPSWASAEDNPHFRNSHGSPSASRGCVCAATSRTVTPDALSTSRSRQPSPDVRKLSHPVATIPRAGDNDNVRGTHDHPGSAALPEAFPWRRGRRIRGLRRAAVHPEGACHTCGATHGYAERYRTRGHPHAGKPLVRSLFRQHAWCARLRRPANSY